MDFAKDIYLHWRRPKSFDSQLPINIEYEKENDQRWYILVHFLIFTYAIGTHTLRVK